MWMIVSMVVGVVLVVLGLARSYFRLLMVLLVLVVLGGVGLALVGGPAG